MTYPEQGSGHCGGPRGTDFMLITTSQLALDRELPEALCSERCAILWLLDTMESRVLAMGVRLAMRKVPPTTGPGPA